MLRKIFKSMTQKGQVIVFYALVVPVCDVLHPQSDQPLGIVPPKSAYLVNVTACPYVTVCSPSFVTPAVLVPFP